MSDFQLTAEDQQYLANVAAAFERGEHIFAIGQLERRIRVLTRFSRQLTHREVNGQWVSYVDYIGKLQGELVKLTK